MGVSVALVEAYRTLVDAGCWVGAHLFWPAAQPPERHQGCARARARLEQDLELRYARRARLDLRKAK